MFTAPVIITLVLATLFDCGIIAVAFRDFLKKE